MTLRKPPRPLTDLMPAAFNKARAITGAETLALAMAATATLAFIGKLLLRSDLSFDFTDEGFYLNWISHPSNFRLSLTQFGYVYHPLYMLTGSSVASLRQANILISFLLAVAVCLCMLRRRALDAGAPFTLSLPLIGFSIVAASTSLLIVIFASSLWLPTPSYNSLAFQSLLVTAIGFCLAEARPSRSGVAGWFLIGVGGFLAFMAKPTTATILGVATLAGLVIGRRLRLRMTVIAIATSGLLLGAYAWLVGGSINQFILDLRRALEASSMLEAKYSIGGVFRIDEFYPGVDQIWFLVFLTLGIAALTLSRYSDRSAVRLMGAIALLLLAATAVVLSAGLFRIEFQSREFQGLQFVALLLAGITCFAVTRLFRTSRRQVASAVFFAVLPLAFVVGTNNNYWKIIPTASFFFTLASFSLIDGSSWVRSSWRQLLPLALTSQVMTVVIVEHGMENPYRDPTPLTSSTIPVNIGAGSLRVSQNFAVYLEVLRQTSSAGGFQTGTPVIDLTGHYPGSLYAIGAKPLGDAWLVGGLTRSNDLAAFNLDPVSCQELAGSWVLTEPDNPLRLSLDLLRRYGIDPQHDFVVAGTLDAPIGPLPQSYKQELLKPKRDPRQALAACEAARAKAN